MENNHENEFEKKPYDPDAQYGFPSRNNSTSRGYNLNGTYYESTSNYDDYADVESKGQEYESQDRDTQNYGTGIYGQNTYISGAQGMANNITPPLDKKGRPLKNKFASRLAWGIILIVESFSCWLWHGTGLYSHNPEYYSYCVCISTECGIYTGRLGHL